MVEQVAVPASIERLGLLDRVTYADAFRVATPGYRTAEEWLWRALNGAPSGLLPAVRVAQSALGLRLAEHSHDHPIGWTILRNEANLLVMGADGPRDAARLTAEVGDGELVVATQTDFSRRTRALWSALQYGHRAAARILIARAARA